MKAIVRLLLDIKFSHTVFAMPFAILGAFMAATFEGPVEWSLLGGQLTVIVLCMVFARTVAMLANRILDRKIDADNPRTSGRALPSGKVTTKQAVVALIVNSIMFVALTTIFGFLWDNWLPTFLALPVLVWLGAYPLFKRFTSMCHFYLGASLAVSPVAATIAIDPAFVLSAQIWLLAGMVLCWVAGFDIIYALQDVEIDRRDDLKSIPARFGERRSLWISQLLHLSSVVFLFGVLQLNARLGTIFLLGICIVTLILVIEHITVRHWGTTKMAMTFLTLNGVVSCLLGLAGVIDLLAVSVQL